MNTKYGELEVQEVINMATILDRRLRTHYMSQEEILVIKARIVKRGGIPFCHAKWWWLC